LTIFVLTSLYKRLVFKFIQSVFDNIISCFNSRVQYVLLFRFLGQYRTYILDAITYNNVIKSPLNIFENKLTHK